ncbi:MAG: L-threonylcarbamoyladenylate synthase [Steroidobacteraceae bacterium]|nr:L-threonylcarbamoyladenylate synthase [Steroidobacteraceae bacterium]
MSRLLELHPKNPQLRLIRQAVDAVRQGGVIVYPTDSCYALGCALGDKGAMERIARLRQIDKDHNFTLVCRDLSELARHARVDNWQYRLLKSCTPGPYTFILEATREVPRRLQNPKRRTIGIRVPDHAVPLLLLEELGEPLMSSTLTLPGDEYPMTDAAEIHERLGHQVELVLDGGNCGLEPTTVVDLAGSAPVVIRVGRGDVAALGAVTS